MNQLLQSMNNLVLAIGNTAPNSPRKFKVVNFLTFSGGDQDPLTWLDEFDEAYVANHISKVRRFDILPSYLKGPAYTWWRNIAYTRSYLNRESNNNEEISELRKAISEMARNMKTLVQRQNKNKTATISSASNLPLITPTSPRLLQSGILCFQYGRRNHIARNCRTQRSFGYNNGGVRQNHSNNSQRRSYGPNGCIPNISSGNNQNQRGSNENQTYLTLTRKELTRAIGAAIRDHLNVILDQPLLSNLPIPLVLNSKIETPDASQSPIEVTYCKATIEQQPIYFILDTGSSKSLISYEFLKKIGKEIDKLLVRNLIDIYGQRKYPLEVVENLLIVVNKIEVPIDVEVTEAKDYAVIVGTDWLGKVREKINLAKRELEYEWKGNKYRTPITCWKRMTYNLGKPVSLEEKSRINSEEIDEEKNEKEYEVKEVEKERSYVVQEDEDELPIVEIKKKTMSIETLKCLVDNLDEELEISQRTKKYANLDKNQQTKVEELMENNKFLFAERLMQLGRTKEEMYTITLKEGVEPVKQRPYCVSYMENEFISQEKFRTQAAQYFLKNNLLYRRNKKEHGFALRVIKESELEQ
ncbi:35709_t:CDS:2, partial [Gigaspora margarita]